MIALIVFFCPAVLAVWCYEALTKTSLPRKKWFYRFSLNTLGINLLCLLVKQFILRSGDMALYTPFHDMVPSVALHYLVVAVPAALIFVLLQIFLQKNVKITVEDSKNE